jgi:hypothetical protein
MVGRGAGLGRGATEVVFVNRPLNPLASSAPSEALAEPSHAAPSHTASGRRLAMRGSSSSSARLSSGMSSTSEKGVPVAGEGHGSSLCMRDCKPFAPEAGATANGDSGDDGRLAIERQRDGYGMKMVRYADGGRLFSSTSGPIEGGPHLGLLGLMDLADGQVGGRRGRDACNLYRVRLREGARTLVLLVDTSSSVGDESTACAAGAALAALDHGFEVEVVNFSSRMMHQAPTRDADAIYETLSTIQRRGTLLPEAGQLLSSSARARDFVAITDTAAGNYEDALDGYGKALKTHPGNRGILYLLGAGVVCKRCAVKPDARERCPDCREVTRAPVEAFEKAGFVIEEAAP